MWPYFLFFLVPAGFAISPINGDKYVKNIGWAIVGLVGILFIGLRFGVGGDWDNYLFYMTQADGSDFISTITFGYGNGLGYMALNWLSLKLGLGMIGVNLICGFIFMTGLIKFCRLQPFPWVGLAVALPYVLFVIAIGYSRQGGALGFFFWALSTLRPGFEHRFLFLVALASLFHFSALILFPLVLLTQRALPRWQKVLAVFFVLLLIGLVVTLDLIQNLAVVLQYTAELNKSEVGATFRVSMNVLPVLVSIFFINRLKSISPDDYLLWIWLSILALCCVPLLAFEVSTLLDRLALYLTPLQVALWPRLIAIQKTSLLRTISLLLVLFYYVIVLFVWFNYANTAVNWLPYQMWPFIEASEFYIY